MTTQTINIYDIPQGTPEWDAVRCGKFTASNIHKLFMGKSTKGYNDYINQIVYERLTGKKAKEKYSNKAMERGIELEPEAINKYELETFDKVRVIGFAEIDDWMGASPDGLVSDDGLIQVKCQDYSLHLDCLLTGKQSDLFDEYQLQWEMFCTERKWNDFYQYHPDLKSITTRVFFKTEIIGAIMKEISIAKMEVEERLTKLRG